MRHYRLFTALLAAGALSSFVVGTAVVAAPQNQTPQITAKVVHIDITVPTADDVIVRRLHPLPHYDDKGHHVRYTPDELAALKGPNPHLIGYTAALSDLKKGDAVELSLRMIHKKGTVKPSIKKEPPAESSSSATTPQPGEETKPEDMKRPSHSGGRVAGVLQSTDGKHLTIRVDEVTLQMSGHRGRQQGNNTSKVHIDTAELSQIVIIVEPPNATSAMVTSNKKK